jgi:hypothetical protein
MAPSNFTTIHDNTCVISFKYSIYNNDDFSSKNGMAIKNDVVKELPLSVVATVGSKQNKKQFYHHILLYSYRNLIVIIFTS